MTAAIEVLDMTCPDRSDAIKAFCTVRIGCIVVAGVRVIQQEGADPWVALPSMPTRKKADGSGSGWKAIIEIRNREVRDQLSEEVLGCYEAERDGERVPLPTRGRQTWEGAGR